MKERENISDAHKSKKDNKETKKKKHQPTCNFKVQVKVHQSPKPFLKRKRRNISDVPKSKKNPKEKK